MNRSITNAAARKRNSQSQRTTKKRTPSDSEQSEEVQSRNITDAANIVVRYVITVGGSNVPIKRADIVKTCLPGNSTSHANAIFKKAKAILNDVYGYELLNCETKNQTMYVVRNALQNMEDDNSRSNDHDTVLKFLVLNHIFLSGGTSADVSLFAFLQSCKLDPHTLHPTYGNITDFVNTRMTREKLITIHVHDETRKVTYSWGPNAEVTVSKMEMLKHFASFGNKNVKSWRTLYADAKEQFDDENEVENQERSE